MSPEFPQEITDQVIDHLWDDTSSLKACALSCQAWLPSSRTHIFREIGVKDAIACARFEGLLQASPAIARYIRKLVIDAHHFSYDTNSFRNGDSSWVGRIPSLWEKLPRVIDLEVTCLNWRTLQLGGVHVQALCTMLAGVKRLVLSNVHFETSAEVHGLLSAAQNLTELRFDRIYWNYWSPSPSCHEDTLVTSSSRPLQCLLLRSGSPPNLVTDWLLSSACELGLRDIQVHWRERDNTKALCNLLRASGGQLENLYLELTNGVAKDSVFQKELDLSHLIGLRTVHFDGLVLPDCCEWIARVLSQIRSTRLETIEISLLARWQDDLRTLDWVALDKTLSQDAFAGLVLTFNVSLAIYHANNQQDAEEIVHGALPSFREKGTLVVKYT